MSVYVPINGLAGTIKATLFNRDDDTVIGQEITLNIFGFKESNEESKDNEIFENMLGDLVKNYYGVRKTISFSVANSAQLGTKNLNRVLALCQYINLINIDEVTNRLEISFRQGTRVSAVITDAVYFGELSPQEISDSSNSGQTIAMQFKSRQRMPAPQFVADDINSIMTAYLEKEDENGLILLENGGKIVLERLGIYNAS